MKSKKLGSPEPFAALNKIPIVENHEPLVDVRIACPRVIVSIGVLPYVRQTVAAMINKAQTLLPPGYRLKVHTALRTLEMQSELYWRHYKLLEQQHPNWPTSALRRANNKYFAAPDTKAPPGHCTGGAVDVAIVGPDGNLLDVTSPGDRWQAANTYTTNLTENAFHNRKLLVDAMFGAGFSNCRDEWWHWSYGDSAWAVRTGNQMAVYTHIAPPDTHTYATPYRELRRIVKRRKVKSNKRPVRHRFITQNEC